MKKVMLYLLALLTLVMCPFSVDAKTKLQITDKPVATKESEDKKLVQYTYEVYVLTTEKEELETVEVSFEHGKAITDFECADAGKFVAEDITDEDAAANQVTCEFAVEDEGQTGEKVLVGKVVVVAEKDAADEDCSIKYTYEGASGKVNPNTGISVPYMFILGGVVLAAGVYFVTSKKTKLFRI